MTRRSRFSYPRREFMRRAAAVSAAMAAPAGAIAQSTTPAPSTPAPEPSTTDPEPLTGGRAGSDFMVDTIKALGFEYICANPGSSFRGLHESVINYGGNEKPELITCMHEESAVAMAHGYFKIEGKPLAVMAHGTVGLQHASMALYNAWCDRVPVYLVLGNTLDATLRAPGVEWVHSVQDAAAMVRDYTKWDDTPMSLPHFGESAVRAYKIAMTPPYGPVVIVADSELQEHPIAEHHGALRVPQLTLASAPQADSGAVAEAAKLLVAADSPLLIADRLARTPAGLARLIELAELLQAAVVSTQPNSLPPIAAGRMNFPNRHPLNQTLRTVAAVADADLIVGLEIANFYGATHIFRDQLERTSRPATKAGVKLITHHGRGFERQGQLPGLPALHRSRPGDGRGRRGNAAGIDRSGATVDDAGSPAGARRARRKAGRREPVRSRARAHRCGIRVGRLADQHRALRGGSVATDSERGLVARQRQLERMAAAAVDLRQASPVHRRVRRVGDWLRHARLDRRRARQPEIRPPLGEHPERRRHDVRTGRALDGGAPQDSDPHRRAQQPQLPRRDDAPAADGESP